MRGWSCWEGTRVDRKRGEAKGRGGAGRAWERRGGERERGECGYIYSLVPLVVLHKEEARILQSWVGCLEGRLGMVVVLATISRVAAG